ncbi:hypothetical protein K5F93_23635 [Pseudomonas protegens]|uniref:hypothetical protein n=1 Tax=Pseudomonas protegens TaxID=380021 RepID=UPI001C8EF05B|nr:hypothetical protein [Pseudomonas protegens]QZI69330.1 hypothetical protein K5F93_23635 [Pseudomonas protegens]
MTHLVLDLHSQINLKPGPLQAGRQLSDWQGLQQPIREVLGVNGIDRDPPRLNRPVGNNRICSDLGNSQYIQHIIANVGTVQVLDS